MRTAMDMDLEHIQFQLRSGRHLHDLQGGAFEDTNRMGVDPRVPVGQLVNPFCCSCIVGYVTKGSV